MSSHVNYWGRAKLKKPLCMVISHCHISSSKERKLCLTMWKVLFSASASRLGLSKQAFISPTSPHRCLKWTLYRCFTKMLPLLLCRQQLTCFWQQLPKMELPRTDKDAPGLCGSASERVCPSHKVRGAERPNHSWNLLLLSPFATLKTNKQTSSQVQS